MSCRPTYDVKDSAAGEGGGVVREPGLLEQVGTVIILCVFNITQSIRALGLRPSVQGARLLEQVGIVIILCVFNITQSIRALGLRPSVQGARLLEPVGTVIILCVFNITQSIPGRNHLFSNHPFISHDNIHEINAWKCRTQKQCDYRLYTSIIIHRWC